MTITPETVAAVNEIVRTHVSTYDAIDPMNERHVRDFLLALAKCEPVRGLVDELDNARVLVRLLTVRQVIQAGDEAINAAGLSPYCMNDGRATGDERIGTWSMDAALAPFAGGGR